MGLGAAVKGLIVMLLGGLGNVPGAMVAGLMLGMIEILSAAYIGTTERDLFSFLILILILLFRPTGLFGTRTAEAKVARMFDGLIDGYTQSMLIFTGINVIAAYSFFAPFKTGQVSLGQAGFMAVGAYASAVMTQKFGMPFAVALPLAGLVAGVVGVVRRLSGAAHQGHLPAAAHARLRRDHLGDRALAGTMSAARRAIRNIPFNPRTLEYVIGIIIVLIVFFARLERSSLGRAMDSIHQDETAAEVMGIDVVRIKLLAFGLGAMIAGLAGALYAHQATFMDSTTFNIMLAVEILMFVVVGGGSTYWGPLARRGGARRCCPSSCARCANGSSCSRSRWTNFYPVNRVYDFLHGFLDFENAKRLIVYGVILIADDDRAARRPAHARLAAPLLPFARKARHA